LSAFRGLQVRDQAGDFPQRLFRQHVRFEPFGIADVLVLDSVTKMTP